MEVIDEKIDITDEKARDIQVERGEIEFQHVWFKYKKEAKEYVLPYPKDQEATNRQRSQS